MDETYREERYNYLSDAAAAMDDGRYDDAIARADARLKDIPGDMDARLVRAACLARMGHPMEASEIVEEWQALLREQSRIYEILGDSYRRGGMTAEAIRSYERFMGLNAGTDEAERVSEKIGALRVSDVDNGEGGTSPRSEDFYTITLARLYVKQGTLPDGPGRDRQGAGTGPGQPRCPRICRPHRSVGRARMGSGG